MIYILFDRYIYIYIRTIWYNIHSVPCKTSDAAKVKYKEDEEAKEEIGTLGHICNVQIIILQRAKHLKIYTNYIKLPTGTLHIIIL